MKLFRGFALLGVLALSSTALSAKSVQISAPPPTQGQYTCVPVSCNGVPAGQACGGTTSEILRSAIALCGGF
jgi:hypothetical protein